MVSDLDLGIGEWELDPEQKGTDHYVQGKVEQGLDLVGVREKTVSSHDGLFSFFYDLSSQRTDLLIVLVLANPASIFLSGTDGEVVAVYTDHSVVVVCWSEGCPCDDNVAAVVGLPFSGIDEGDSVEEEEGDTCSRD